MAAELPREVVKSLSDQDAAIPVVHSKRRKKVRKVVPFVNEVEDQSHRWARCHLFKARLESIRAELISATFSIFT